MKMKQASLPQFHDRADVLNQIQEMLYLKKEKKLKNIEGMKYQRYIEGEPELSSLMVQYAQNLSRLYVLVLKRVRNVR